MTPKQRRFIEEYLIDGNATQAAIRAEYSPNGAEVTGHRLLRNPKIAEAIAAGERKRQKRTQIDQDYVITTIVDTIKACQTPGDQWNPNAVLKGTELLGKTMAMFTDVNKSTVTLVEQLSDSELDDQIGRQEAVLGLAARKAPKTRANGSDQVH